MVDEKLQRTLDERMTNSFRLVNERLEQVYKGLGEMQTLAVGVATLNGCCPTSRPGVSWEKFNSGPYWRKSWRPSNLTARWL